MTFYYLEKSLNIFHSHQTIRKNGEKTKYKFKTKSTNKYRIYLRINDTFYNPKLTPKFYASYTQVILKGKVIFGII